MKQLWSVMRFEFLAFANNKTFIGISILMMVIAFIAPAAPAIIDRLDFGGFGAERTIAVVDNTGMFSEDTLAQFVAPSATMGFSNIDAAIAAVENGYHNYALELKDGGFTLHVDTMGFGATGVQNQVFHMFQHVYRAQNVAVYGVTAERIDEILFFMPTAELLAIGDAYATIDSFAESFLYAYVMAFILYFALLIGGGHLLTTVVREKSTKTMELLVTSCPPSTMMNGKVLGVGAAILSQVVLMAAAAFTSMQLTPIIFEGTDALSISISPFLLGMLVLFFLLGFIMFSYIYAALASTTSRMEDAQSLGQIPQLLIVAGFIGSIVGMQNPGAAWVPILSHIPLTAPFVMFGRITVGTTATWEIYVSIAVQIVTIAIIAWMAAKIYRMGTLMYGAKPTMKGLLEAFK